MIVSEIRLDIITERNMKVYLIVSVEFMIRICIILLFM